MNQKGVLIVAVIVLGLAAAGALFVWMLPSGDEVATASDTEAVSLRTSGPTISSEYSIAMNTMKQSAGDAGFAATFASGTEQWVLSEGHKLEKFSLGKDAAFARLTSSVPIETSKVVDGLYVELPLDFAVNANGRKVQVGIVARAAQSNPASRFSALYATQQAGNSGWKSIAAGEAFELHTFEFLVPKQTDGYSAKPVISIRADDEGREVGLELIGVYAKVLPLPPFAVDFVGQSAKWIVPEGHDLTAVQTASGAVVGRLVSKRPLKGDDTNLGAQGAAVQIPLAAVQKFNGKRIEISVTAKSSASNPSSKLWVVFATQQNGNSGWKQMPLSGQLSTFTFDFSVPAVAEGYTNPSIIVLHADDSGAGQAVDVRSMEIKIVK
jgi:hypothetical protein